MGAFLFAGHCLYSQVPQQTQSIGLNVGWNLVSVQVLGTEGDGGFSVASVTNAVVDADGTAIQPVEAIWQYHDAAGPWTTAQPSVPGYPDDLLTVIPGKGYWIKVNQSCFLQLTGSPWNGALAINPGWNLVGFPGIRVDSGGSALDSVFREHLASVQQIWSFDSTPAKRTYVGYDTSARPVINDLQLIEPGKAYWVRWLTNATALTSQPAISMPGDVDFPPLSTNTPPTPGAEDLANGSDLNGNGVLDSAFTQDVLVFGEGIDQRIVTIHNQAHGRLNWYAANPNLNSWFSFATATPVVDASAMTADLVSAQAGRTRQAGTNFLAGSVAAAPAHLTVQVDRSGLLPGSYTNQFSVWAGSSNKTITVIAKVPPVDGDWVGFAATKRVNGKPVSLGKVDLSLALSRIDENLSGQGIRAVIKREESLLFPKDVFLNGAFYSDHSFFLTANFQVSRGDRNAPPFDKFAHDGDQTVTGFGDIDVNRDGKLDNSNPFPFDLRREISLIGERIDSDRLVGDYYRGTEVIGHRQSRKKM